jgi:hypothetical protein
MSMTDLPREGERCSQARRRRYCPRLHPELPRKLPPTRAKEPQTRRREKALIGSVFFVARWLPFRFEKGS